MASGNSIVIVGGGICGVCTAYFLCEEGFAAPTQITLIETEAIASKASGKAAGFIAKDWHGPPTADLGRLSFELHKSLAAKLDDERAYGYRVGLDNLSLSVRPASAKAAKEAGTAALVMGNNKDDEGEEKHELEAHSEVHKIIFRAKPPPTGAAPASAWLDQHNVRRNDLIGDPAGSAQVDPRRFCETVWAECERRGVRLLRGVVRRAASSSSAEGRRVLKVATNSAGDEANLTEVPYDKLIIAAGPWSGDVLKLICGGVDVAGITNLPGHSVIIQPAAKTLPAEAVFADIRGVPSEEITTGPELFTRPSDELDGGRTTIYAAGENTGLPLPTDPSREIAPQDEAITRLLKACALISPALAEGRVLTRSLCYRPMTERGYPFISEVPDHPGIFLNSGHGPWGISLGPGSGKVMADLVLGKHTSADIGQLSL
ncbi:hypothetical protein V8E36_006597 [Tilletia maclaganii]